MISGGVYPVTVTASILSSILGEKARADVGITSESLKNSQNMNLLEANVSFLSLSENKESKKTENSIDANVNLIVLNNALLPSASPVEAFGIGGNEFGFFEDEISIYVVHKGDTVQAVADLFGISSDTILSANDLKKGDKLKEGDVLLILPYSGVEHTVAKGETLQGIALKYKANIDDILSANDIEGGTKIAIGEKLMIPGASMISEIKPKSSGGSIVKGGNNMPVVAGYFKNPVPGGKKSRGIKPGHKGVDIAAPTGTPIYAAAEGTVLIARNGWNGGFGNYVVIQHPNGVKTLYAHMNRLGTTSGAKVSQGEIIGYVGSTGKSTGPHLHFETLGAKNPF